MKETATAVFQLKWKYRMMIITNQFCILLAFMLLFATNAKKVDHAIAVFTVEKQFNSLVFSNRIFPISKTRRLCFISKISYSRTKSNSIIDVQWNNIWQLISDRNFHYLSHLCSTIMELDLGCKPFPIFPFSNLDP